jgi:hypothetical protein
VTNWPEYDAALVRRGSLTVWFTAEAVAAWHVPASRERGGQPIYSAIAIKTGLALRLAFHQPLRQTEGLLRSIADLLGVDIAIPDHTTLSRRGGGLTILLKRLDRAEPLHLLVYGTRLKICGEGEWLDQKHGIRSRRRWRKLHLGIDVITHEVVTSELTPDNIGDVSEVPAPLDQIDANVASMTSNVAYDGEAVYDAVAERHPETVVIIPSRTTPVLNETTTTQRDRHIAEIEEHGCMGWQRRSSYNRRSLVETAMYRYKTVVGRWLHARTLLNQRTRQNLLQCAQPDDNARHARHRSDPLVRAATAQTQPAIYSCTKPFLRGHDFEWLGHRAAAMRPLAALTRARVHPDRRGKRNENSNTHRCSGFGVRCVTGIRG